MYNIILEKRKKRLDIKTMEKKQFINKKSSCIIAIVSLLIWLMTFITDRKIFSSDALNMSSLPIDTDAVLLMHILSKGLLFVVIFSLLFFFYYAFHNRKLLLSFCIFFALYMSILLLNYPGYFMSDDAVIFGYATRYYPVYWHNYLTSIYYMIGLSLFPASTGPIILHDIVLSLVFSYIFFETDKLFTKKIKYVIVLLGICPFVLLSAAMCFRPVLYAPFFLFFYAFLFFEKRKQAAFTVPKAILLSVLCAILCFWRSEGILLICFCIFLIPCAYGLPKKSERLKWKQIGIFFLIFILSFVLIKIPQSNGEDKYYGSDYLIISTIRPISLIVHRDQTYEEAAEDLSNIDAIISLDYILYETLSCSSYNRYNSDFNSGHFTETGADEDTQKAYIKSALRLISHNLDLYIAERLQLFAVTNGIYDYNKAMVMNLEPVTTAEFLSFQSDRSYGYELVKGNARWHYESDQNMLMFLFHHGGEAYLPILCIAFIFMIYTLVSGNWFFFFALASLIAREAVIFLTAPASFIQYNYPTMYVSTFLLVMLFVSACEDGFFQNIKGLLSRSISRLS